jgi:hypothetical protein
MRVARCSATAERIFETSVTTLSQLRRALTQAALRASSSLKFRVSVVCCYCEQGRQLYFHEVVREDTVETHKRPPRTPSR